MARRLTLYGWMLFLVSSVLFVWAGVRAGDLLVTGASVAFLVGVVLAMVPEIRRADDDRAGAGWPSGWGAESAGSADTLGVSAPVAQLERAADF